MNKKDYQKCMLRLAEMEALMDGWDGSTSIKIRRAIINEVSALLKRLTFPPEIYPLPDGFLQLEYDNHAGDYLELQVILDDDRPTSKPYVSGWVCRHKANCIDEFDDSDSSVQKFEISDIPKFVHKFMIATETN
jgi:hypothetical protein